MKKRLHLIQDAASSYLCLYLEIFIVVIEVFLEQRIELFVLRKSIDGDIGWLLPARLSNLRKVNRSVLWAASYILPTKKRRSAVRLAILVLLTADATLPICSRHIQLITPRPQRCSGTGCR